MFFHIVGLWALAVAQPLFDLLGDNPEFFVAHHAGAADLLILTAALAGLLPLLVGLPVWLAGRVGPRSQSAALGVVVASLTGILVMQGFVRAATARWMVAVPCAVVLGAGVALAYRRWAGVRSFFSVLAVAGLVVPGMFLTRPGVRRLIAGGSGDQAAVALAAQGSAAKTPIVLVIFDELSMVSLLDANRQIDPVLYPNFAALANDGVWYRNATTVSDFTRWAVPAILTGRYPSRTALPSAADHPNTLFTLLAGSHRLEIAESVTSLCPPRLCAASGDESLPARLLSVANDLRVVFLHLTLTEDLKRGLPDLTQSWAGFGTATGEPGELDEANESGDAREAVRQRWREGITASRVVPVRQFIAGISERDAPPTFYFIHTLVSHHPHFMLPGGKENKTWVGLPRERDRAQSWAIGQEHQRHLLQVGFVDGLIGELVRRLKDAGLYDQAMVVITADHGVSYAPGASLRNFESRNAAEIARVPLIVKYPGRVPVSAHVSDANVEAVDILPTVAEVLDVSVPWKVDGWSLIDARRPSRSVKTLFRAPSCQPHTMPAEGPDVKEALERKLALFGDGRSGNLARAARVPQFDPLIGQPVSALRTTDGGGTVEVSHAWEYEAVDGSAPAVVFDVGGRFAVPHPGASVAVAVNGVVQAITRTWDSSPRGWLATPPPGAWRDGRNAIDVFLVQRDQGGVVLRRAQHGQARPDTLNLLSKSAAEEWGVSQRGFWAIETPRSGKRFRWTRDRAELSNLLGYGVPRELQVEVMMVPGGQPKDLKIEANDCALFHGPVTGGWSATLPLGRCDIGRGLTIRFSTPANRAANGRDRRLLGVALSRVTLR